jgi:hypothetical protein
MERAAVLAIPLRELNSARLCLAVDMVHLLINTIHSSHKRLDFCLKATYNDRKVYQILNSLEEGIIVFEFGNWLGARLLSYWYLFGIILLMYVGDILQWVSDNKWSFAIVIVLLLVLGRISRRHDV